MSSLGSEKQPKAKSKKAHASKSSKSTRGSKEGNVMVEKFRGDGVNFKCKLLGVAEVDGPRGDTMCAEAIKKLKLHQRQSGEHKMKIILNVTLMGIRILEEKTKNILFEHPVNKVSFITHDPDDKKIFSFISSAKCSAGSVGHMMYAIKYDKVAGIITSTLYDLFQAVFKLRQEAALKQRKVQKEPQPLPQNSLHPANNAVLSNGPSESIISEDSNIYEEPNSTASAADVKEEDEQTHYKVPIPRPLPPAPYSSPSSQDNLPATENNADSSNQVAVSSSDNFFSSSVFSTVDHPDNLSESSIDVTRKSSISSSISSTSETASFDSRSIDLKSGATSCTPPVVPRARSTASSTGHTPTMNDAINKTSTTSETQPTPQDDDPDYETISSTDYETIPSDVVTKSLNTEVTETKASFGEFSFKESFGKEESFPFEAEKKSNAHVDPFASEPSLKKSEGSPPSSAVFGNDDDFFSSNFDDKAATPHAPMVAFPVDDPFAPTLTSDPQESQSTDPFAFSDAFESAFGSGELSPFEVKKNGAQAEEDGSSPPKQKAFDSDDTFESAFDTPDMLPVSKPTENNFNDQVPSICDTRKDLSWSNVFGNDNLNDDDDQKSRSSWAATFEDSKCDSPEDKQTKTTKKEVSFSFDDSFGYNGEEQDNSQQPDNVAAEPDFSWAGAFKEPSQQKVTFSWDDTFGGETDSQSGEMGNKDGKTNKEGGQTDNDFNAEAFNDAFSSTPFMPTKPKDEFQVKSNAAIAMPNFVDILSPMKPNPPVTQTNDQTDSDLKEKDIFTSPNFNAEFVNFQSDKLANDKNENISNDFDVKTKNVFPMDDFSDILSPQKSNSLEGNSKEQSYERDGLKIGTGNEEAGYKQGNSNELGAYEGRPKSTDAEDLKGDDRVDRGNTKPKEEPDQVLTSTIPQIIEPGKDENSESEDEHNRPDKLPMIPTETSGRKESPSAPPPLPPRPAMAPLPSLPPRPRPNSSPHLGQLPATPPHPMGSSPFPAPKTGTPKRVPPALPPRIDLENGDLKTNSPLSGTTMKITSDPFSSVENSWQADWTGGASQNTEKGKDSKKSPDPFGDAFFTDFNFTNTAENYKLDSVNQNSTGSFSDPFLAKEGSDDMFQADFGGVDPFADFSSNKSTVDPFASDGSDVFSGFSTTNDPFVDSVDPFAEKGTLSDDPFAVSPKRDGTDGNTALQLAKNSDDGDFADSFA